MTSYRREARGFVGRRVAVLFTKTYGRMLASGLGLLDTRLPAAVKRCNALAVAWHRFEVTLDAFIQRNVVAA